MTTEIRSQLNVRIDPNSNMSISVASLVDTEAEAKDAGLKNARLVTAYLAGYGAGAEAEETT